MKELFNPEDDKRVVEDVSEKTSESEPKSTTVKSMDFFSKGNSDNKNTNSDSQREDLLEQELLKQEVNFSKTGIVSSAAEDLELPDNVDVSKLEDEDGDSSIVQFPTPKGRTMADFEAQCEAQRQRAKQRRTQAPPDSRFSQDSKDSRFSPDHAMCSTKAGRSRSDFEKQCERQRQLREERKRKREEALHEMTHGELGKRPEPKAPFNPTSEINIAKPGVKADLSFDLSKDETGFKPESRTIPRSKVDLSDTVILTFPEGIHDGDENTLTFIKGKFSYIVDLTSESAKEDCVQALRRNTHRSFAWYKEKSGNQNWVLFDLAQYSIDSDAGMFLRVKEIPEGTLELPVNASSCYKMFSGIELNNKFSFTNAFNTSEIVTMANMFENAVFTKTIYFPTNFTSKNVKDMSFMFLGAKVEIPFKFTDSFNARNAISLKQMFCDAEFYGDFELPNSFSPVSANSLEAMFSSLKVKGHFSLPEGFDTQSVINMSRMFSNFKFPKDFKLPKYFYTDNVKDLSAMFCGAVLPTEHNILENFRTGNCINFNSMFLHAELPDNFSLPESFSTGNAVNMLRLFYGCTFPKGFRLPESFSTEKAVVISEMFYHCTFKTPFSLPPAFIIDNVKNKDFIFMEAKGLGVITLTTRQTVKSLHERYKRMKMRETIGTEDDTYNGMELPNFIKKRK
ncbi:BspA family leucine-rich repeat surface protein [Anaerobutyricum soehngenii]|uniref:BspA family leucine-rich repeat surface protein n=1 Tax=Anaerobutyricum soehngenii TaxID=105843 RepID=UPI0032C0882C